MSKIAAIKTTCKRFDIALVYLFGSSSDKALGFTKGFAARLDDPLTDIDVGLVFNKALPKPGEKLHLYAAVSNTFADIFSPNRVDIAFLEENHAIFQVEAIRGHILENELGDIYAFIRQVYTYLKQIDADH